MALKTKVEAPFGMLALDFWPITAEPENAHPTYGPPVNLGAAVKGSLTVTTAEVSIVGDDVEQLSSEFFVSGQLDTETTMNDLQINSQLFGHSWTETDGEESKSSDSPIPGGLSFIQKILTSGKTIIYRTTCLRKSTALASSEKQEAETRKPNEIIPQMNPMSFKLKEDNLGSWRVRQDCETEEAALAFIKKTFGAAT